MNYPDWVIKHKSKGTAIHKIGNNYYLYEVTSKWDKNLKRARKVTKGYLGVITPEGLKVSRYKENRPTTLKEYGASCFLLKQNQEVVEGLKRCFPEWWKELFILSVFRFIHKSPLKHMQLHYEDSWLSEQIKGVRLHEKVLHSLLENVGSDRSSIAEFLKGLIFTEEGVLIDLTHIFSLAENMSISSLGYNKEFNFTPQVNLLFIFSLKERLPLFYRLLPGNVRDVKSLKATIKESGLKDVIIIGDKGFYSKENVELLEREGLNYILPLKRSNTMIDYTPVEKRGKSGFEGYFRFQKRYIWYYRGISSSLPVWVFLDEHLRVSEQEDYLSRIETHPEEYTEGGFYKRLPRFGTISLITNLNGLRAKRVFEYFKSRIQIEVMFDSFKNVLRADRSYMRTDKGMEAWIFINYLALMYYYKVYNLLVEKELLKRYSPSDVLLYLSKIRKVKTGTKWIELEIPKQTRKLIEKIEIPIT